MTDTPLSDQERALQSLSEPDAPPAEAPPAPEPAAEPEPAEPEPEADRKKPETREERLVRLRAEGSPYRSFRWVDDSKMTVDDWLANLATADIEVFPNVVFRFHEPSDLEMREADAVVNSMGPAFVMTGLIQPDGSRGDMVRGEQWSRAKNIALLACALTHMEGDPFPEGKSLKDKYNCLAKMGHIKLDRLIAAYAEFTITMAYMVEVGDLPNS